jgi:hypothetical protein
MTAYIVNGIGRCGTTLVFDFLRKYYKSMNFIKDLSALNKIEFSGDNVVYKTHSLNTIKAGKQNVKILFMFGNIYNSAISYDTRIMSKKVMEHLFIDRNFKKNYLQVNKFEFGRYFSAWYKPLGYPVMFVRYEKLQENLKAVLDFCDLGKYENQFPKIVKRSTDWTSLPEITKNKLIKIYGNDQKIVDGLPDIKILQ